MYKDVIFNNIETIKIKARFKFYPNIFANDKRELIQISYCKNKRTLPFRVIKYNEIRNGYQINGVWVSKNRMIKNIILVDEEINLYN